VTETADLDRAVATVVGRCLGVEAREEVVVVGDAPTREIAEALRDEAARIGADAVLIVMEPRENDGAEPPRSVAGALAGADVFIAPTSRSLSHTRARKVASDRGARGATLPGVTVDMLARLMSVDFDVMTRRSRQVAELLSDEAEARVTCPHGTELTLDLRHRSGTADDGDLTMPGAFGNLPCGEGFIAPHGGHGRLWATTLPGHGVAEEPVALDVEKGRLARGEGPIGEAFVASLERHGRNGLNLAELGVGTNERAIVTGNVLEDEKILGSIHVAFGASAGIGGNVSVPVHLDVIVLDASLEIGGTPVLDAGRWVL
jgi:leucyl aminopeptidase (aminopeptidase T)